MTAFYKQAVLLAALATTPLAALPAAAQSGIVQQVAGTRLDVVATGEVTRVPDLIRITAGVMTQAPTASEAIRQNAAQLERIRAALRRARVAERDIQTASISLQPEFRYAENRTPEFVGYRASNQLSLRFRETQGIGAVLDALVTAGANQIEGPNLTVERPEAALDEARTVALRNAQSRAELYARALGKRVRRVLAVTESGAVLNDPRPMMRTMDAQAVSNVTVAPGEQTLGVTLTVSYELE